MTSALQPEATDRFLSTAAAIGRRLLHDAIWHNGRCNWMGAEPIERQGVSTFSALTHRALGVDLYGGTSGVALFLGELYAITGDKATCEGARGAIRHAFSRLDLVPPSARLGLFTGWPGIALVAARLGRLLHEPEWLEQAQILMGRLATERENTEEFDIIAGRAGAIAALVVLNKMLGERSLLILAEELGHELLVSGEKGGAGYSWVSPGLRNKRNLTGFSHGAAGVSYALLELFAETGSSCYQLAAEQALAYERHWFNSKVGNWPDFRANPPVFRSSAKVTVTCATHWCHGAPGIALSRLRAWELFRDSRSREEAAIALATTRGNVETALREGSANYSLCHGLAGNTESLIYGQAVLRRDDKDGSAEGLAQRVADMGIERYAGPGQAWPCGTHSEETPNLMLGLAGIGHFYLRLSDPEIPSVLILRHEAFCKSGKI